MKEAALSKRRKAAEELLQCHQKLLEEEKRVVELEAMAKSIICPKNDATKKRKTWSIPAPISVPKHSEKTSAEYASDFEVESIVDAVDQNIKDLMSDFSKVQDNISMLGISKSSKSDEDENKEEENSVIETKKSNKNSTGTISSISSSVRGSVEPDISEQLSKTRTSEAASHIDSELSIHTVKEHSMVPEVSEKISSSLSSPKSEEECSAVPEVSEKLSKPSNDRSDVSTSKVSAHISEKVPSVISETNSVPECSEKLKKSIENGLDISDAKISQRTVSKHSSQGTEKTGVSEKISELTNEETNILDGMLPYKSSAISEISEKPLEPQGTIKSDIASESKTAVELSEEILNSLQGQNYTSNGSSSAASPRGFSKALPEIEDLNDIPKTKANSHSTHKILSEKNGSKISESVITDRVSVKLSNSSQEGQGDVSLMSNSVPPPRRSDKSISKKSSDKIAVVPEVLNKQSDSLQGIEDLSDSLVTKAASHSSDKIVSERSDENRSQSMANDEVSEEVLNSLQKALDNASEILSSAASIHRSDKLLPEKGSAQVYIVPEVLEKLSDSLPEITDLNESAKTTTTSNDYEGSLYKDSIKKQSVESDRSLKVSKAIKVNDSVQSISEITPKYSTEVSSEEISERIPEVSRGDSQKLKETGASQTLSNISSADLNENVLATVASDIIQRAEVDCSSKSAPNKTSAQVPPDEIVGSLSETSDNKDLVESETKDTNETPSNGVIESLLGASEVTQGSQQVPKVTEENKTSEVLPSEASCVSTGVLSKNEVEELAPKSTISGIIEEALQEVYGMDETVYKYFKRNSAEATATEEAKNDSKSVGIDKSDSINQKESVGILSKPEGKKHVPYRSESTLEQLQNEDEVIPKKIADSVETRKSVEGISGSEEWLSSGADSKTNEKDIYVVGNRDKGSSRAELRETEEHRSTGLRSKSAEETNVPYASDETEQRSFIEKDSLKETDIDEELSLDASEEHIITPLTVPDRNSDTSVSKSSSNRGILDLSYGAVDTSFTKEINSYEEKEQDSLSPQNDEGSTNVEEIKSVTQESVKSIDVKKRVLEIMADANLTRGDKSPRLQDIYTTTYDLASPTNSPEFGSPIDVNKNTAPVSIFGEEAEEIFKQQLAIEQEIKAITEQQQKEQQLPFLFVREIPNKPPPPYTPPSSLPPVPPVQPIVPTRDEIDEITKYASKILYKAHLGGKLDKVTISDSTLNLIGTTISKDRYRFVFDLCKEICRWHYEQFEESTCPSWLRVTRKPKLAVEKPLDAAGLEKHMTKKLRELYGYEKPIIRENAIIKWCKKKRNNIDEILITESLQEESQWTNFEKDDKLVMDQVTNEIMNMLLIKETEEVFRNVFCRKIL